MRTYFSVTEWARLVKAEKGRLKNLKRNHLTMLALGKYHLVYTFVRILFTYVTLSDALRSQLASETAGQNSFSTDRCLIPL